MKQGIHPEAYRFVVFKDMSNNTSFLGKSTANTKETIKWEDGNEYPVIKLEISNTSHPFYTGKNMLVDTAGRIDKFNKRYAKAKYIKTFNFINPFQFQIGEGFLFQDTICASLLFNTYLCHLGNAK